MLPVERQRWLQPSGSPVNWHLAAEFSWYPQTCRTCVGATGNLEWNFLLKDFRCKEQLWVLNAVEAPSHFHKPIIKKSIYDVKEIGLRWSSDECSLLEIKPHSTRAAFSSQTLWFSVFPLPPNLRARTTHLMSPPYVTEWWVEERLTQTRLRPCKCRRLRGCASGCTLHKPETIIPAECCNLPPWSLTAEANYRLATSVSATPRLQRRLPWFLPRWCPLACGTSPTNYWVRSFTFDATGRPVWGDVVWNIRQEYKKA